jgi:hypothetical protein
MNFPCIKCGATLYGIVPNDWPFPNIFPITCSSCGEQQLITAKGIMNWTEAFEVLDKAFTVKGVCFADISNDLPKWETNQTAASRPPITTEENVKAQDNDASSGQVVNILTWKKRKK